MNERTRKIVFIAGVVIILAGVLGLLYPFVGDYINSRQHKAVVAQYREEVQEITEDKGTNELLEAAVAYNERLYARGGIITNLSEKEREEYNSMLAMSVTTIMGYIDIPKIDVSLPIYHSTEEKVLQVGVGHLEGSSLPVGGVNTHMVFSGHAGLPSSTLFTNLDQLAEGDRFTITVLDNTVSYEVDGMEVKLPEDVSLMIEEGKDLCTLITCTPIGANTHRLLVHAHRVENDTPAQEDGASIEDLYFPYIVISLAGISFIAVAVLLHIRRAK